VVLTVFIVPAAYLIVYRKRDVAVVRPIVGTELV
jgi:hypothetical protein